MNMKILLMLFACWAISSIAHGQSHNAVWVHGLGAGANEWSQWDALFTAERQLNTISRTNFNTDNGVAQMANDVKASYASAASTQNIYFGHSTGGVAGRHIDTDSNSPNTFGAIITAGSPHNGARIANAARNGELINAVADGVSTMAAGPMNDITLNLLFFSQFTVAGLAVEVAVNQLKAPAQSYLNANFSNQTVTDLMEGSSYMNSSPRNTQTNTAKLLVYGNEESPVHWRIASEAAYNDDRLVGYTNTVYDVYSASMWVNYGFATVAGAFTFGLGAIPFVYCAIQWGRGMNWIRYDSERVWNYLIGAGIPSYFQVCYEGLNQSALAVCLGIDNPDYATVGADYATCANSSIELVCYNYYASTNGQSDGFIKSPSQTGYNSGWANNATAVEALGVNHLEMSKHPAMAVIYRDAFDNVYGSAFATARR